jgi:DNA-directed RNA polymerase sigma subunit (sigma70/sigma32)
MKRFTWRGFMATTRRRLTPKQAERRARVVELRRSRMTFDAIGHQLGISSQRAGRIFSDALAALPRHGIDELRAEETARTRHQHDSG